MYVIYRYHKYLIITLAYMVRNLSDTALQQPPQKPLLDARFLQKNTTDGQKWYPLWRIHRRRGIGSHLLTGPPRAAPSPSAMQAQGVAKC